MKFLTVGNVNTWINCPGSVIAQNAKYSPDYTGGNKQDARLQGITAHALAEVCITRGHAARYYVQEGIHGNHVSLEMAADVQLYVDYISATIEDDEGIYVEYEMTLSKFLSSEDRVGVADVIGFNSKAKHLNIFEFKYGKSNIISAYENYQGLFYALGFLDEKVEGAAETITIHVCQPGRGNFDTWKLSYNELVEYGEMLKTKSAETFSETAPRIPGTLQCKSCIAKPVCPELASTIKDLLLPNDDFSAIAKAALSDEMKKDILDNAILISATINSIKKEATDRIKQGGTFKGYKLVNRKGARKWKENAHQQLQQILGEEAYEKKLIGLGKATAHVGKDVVGELTLPGHDTQVLVPESDPRESNSIFDKFK